MLRYGIISASSIVTRFMQGAVDAGDTITAIAARDPERAKQKARGFGQVRCYGNYDDVYSKKDVDICYIANINHLHYQQAKKAIRSGKHVLLEKPFVLQSGQVPELFRLAEENGVFLMEAQKSVFLPATLKAKALIEEKAIGDCKLVELSSSYLTHHNPWVREERYGGGTLFANAIYTVEYLNFLFDTTVTDAALVSTFSQDGSPKDTALQFFIADTLCTSRIASSVLSRDGALITGTKGYIWIENYWKARTVFVHYNDETRKDETFSFPVQSEFVYEARHVRSMIEQGRLTSPVMSESATYNAIALLERLSEKAHLKYSALKNR